MTREQQSVRALFTQLQRAPLRTFPNYREKLEAPDRQGVYVIYSPRGRVVHVGRTPKAKRGIAQRLSNHMAAASSFAEKYLEGQGHKLRGRYKYRCLVVNDRRVRALLEAYAIGHLCPAHIGLG